MTVHTLSYCCLKKKEEDIIPLVLTPTQKRARTLDFTVPLLIDYGRLMLRYPEEESRLAAVGQPFGELFASTIKKKRMN